MSGIHTSNVESPWILRYPASGLNLAARTPVHTRRSFLPKLAPLVVVGAVLALTSCSRGANQTLVIGLSGPFSQARGVAMRRAAELAVREVNARGGRQIALRIMDDSGSAAVAIRVARELLDDPTVVAVIGHLSSGSSLAAGRVYSGGRRPLAMISPSASSPDLSGVSPYVFRVCPSDLSHGAQLARYAQQTIGAKRAAIIYINDDYGRGLRQSFATEFRRLGGTIVEEDPMLSATPSLEPYLSRLRQTGAPDVLMLATERGGAELALREMRRIGVAWPTIGGDALTGIEGLGALAQGVRLSTAYLPDRPGDANQRFVAAYARAYNGERSDHRGAGAYDIVQLLARAFAAGATTRRGVRDYLAHVGGTVPAFEGVTGTIAFDAQGDVPAKSVVIGVVRDGHLVTEASQ